MPFVALAVLNGMWKIAASFSFAEVLVNGYPIPHLRHIRGRLGRTITTVRTNAAR